MKEFGFLLYTAAKTKLLNTGRCIYQKSISLSLTLTCSQGSELQIRSRHLTPNSLICDP
jgi:hypothetical protein